MTTHHEWFRRTVGHWTSERRYIFNLETKKPTNLTTKFTIDALLDGEYDFQVVWTGQTSGTMKLKLSGNELHRDVGYFTSDPTVSFLSLLDKDTLVMHTSYDGMRFREEIRLLDDDRVRLRQTIGHNIETGEVALVGQYYEERIS